MTRWAQRNYDFHKSIDIYTLANKSSIFWPTLNCSRPLVLSTATRYAANLINESQRQIQTIDNFEIVHRGNVAVRIGIDDLEGVANDSQGKILFPGESWNPPFRIHQHLTLYTSSNVSQSLQLSIGGYR